MGRLLVRDRARADVSDIAAYIVRDNVAARLRFLDEAAAAFELLASNPLAGSRLEPPLELVADLRFWPIAHYQTTSCCTARSRVAPKSYASSTAVAMSPPCFSAAEA